MGWISAVFIHKALDVAEQEGLLSPTARRDLCRGTGIISTDPIDPKTMVSDTAFFGLLERLDQLGPTGRSVPIQLGASMRCDDYGVFGLAFKSAPDLLASYRRVERFGKVVTSIANFQVEQSETMVRMSVIPGRERRLGLTMTNELAVAAALALSREVSRVPIDPTAVYLAAPAPARDEAYRDHFQCPIQYEAVCDALEIDIEMAARPNRLADDGISTFFEAHLDHELSEIGASASLEQRVLDQIGDSLSEGIPKLSEVAGQLGMGGRTLQRRLSEAGVAYQDLVTDARRMLAERLLRHTEFGLAEIAFLTGFSDQSAFTRAFKRWHGQTPATYRRRA